MINGLSQPEKFCVMSVYAKLRLQGFRSDLAAEHAWSFARKHFLRRTRALWWDLATERDRCYRQGKPGTTNRRFCPLGEALGVERTQGRAQHTRDTLAYLERHYAPFRDLVQRF